MAVFVGGLFILHFSFKIDSLNIEKQGYIKVVFIFIM